MNTLVPTNLTQGNRPVNVYEWSTKHVIDWLKEHDLQDYYAIFEMQKIDGEQLLNTNEEKAIHEFKLEDDEDRKTFMQELDLLKEYHSLRRKQNIIEEGDRMDKESSQIIPTINIKMVKVSSQPPKEFERGGFGDNDSFSDSSIMEFEDNDSTLNRKLLEDEIKMIVKMLQQCGGEKLQSSMNINQVANDVSQRYGMTLSKPYVLSQNNLANSTASLAQPFTSTDYQSQWYNESLSMSKQRIPYFFESPNIRTNNDEEERISEVFSYQENQSTIPLTTEERLSFIVNQSLIIKDSHEQGKHRFYEIFSSEAAVGIDGNISSNTNGTNKKIGVFKSTASQKGSKQEYSLNSQSVLGYGSSGSNQNVSGSNQNVSGSSQNMNGSSQKCNWQFKALNTSQIIALQVVKRIVSQDDIYFIGNHTITIKRIEVKLPDQCDVIFQIGRLDDQLYYNLKKFTLDANGIVFGKNRKISTVFLDQDKVVSSNHCSMLFDSTAKCPLIIDNASTNGTWIQLKGGKQENINIKMHLQIDVKRDIMVYDCIDNPSLDLIRKNLVSACMLCQKDNRNTRNLRTYKIELCCNCSLTKCSDNWAYIIY